MGEAVRPSRSRRLGPPRPPPRKVSLWIVPVLGVAGLFMFLMTANLREPVPGTVLSEPPPEVVGRWTSADSAYADRGLRISSREVVLELGSEGPPMRGGILVVSIREEDQGQVLYIEYDTGEGPTVLEMILDGDDRMHLRNQPDVIWTRAR